MRSEETIGEDVLFKASRLAMRLHEGHTYGGSPYVVHVMDVAYKAQSVRPFDHDFVAAAYLHDCIEDTSISLKELADLMGEDVAGLVFAVTDAPGRNRRERKAGAYKKMSSTPGAVLLKLCDRICNVENCWKTRDKRLFMYRSEHKAFRKALFDPSDEECFPLWEQLDELLCL